MVDLVIRLRFPAGRYDATGPDGNAEWPPSPERVASALLSVAGTDAPAVRALYEFNAPMIVAPVVGRQRDASLRRWVLRQALGLALADKPDGKVLKPNGISGVFVDPDAVVEMLWAQVDVDAQALAEVAMRVGYLGRPTSPVLVSVHTELLPDQSGRVVHVPSRMGRHMVSVPGPKVLAMRDMVWRMSQQAPGGNAPMPMVARRFVKYAVRRPPAAVGRTSRRDAWAFASSGTWFAVPETWRPEHAVILVASLRSAGATSSCPAFVDGRLVGAWAGWPSSGADVPDVVAVLVGGKLRRVSREARVAPQALDALAWHVVSSQVWTTVLPTHVGPGVGEQLSSMGEVAEVVAHDEPLGPAVVHPQPVPGDRHVTVVFAHPVRGPLFLDGVALHPVDTMTEQEA